jgi:hypothetical protein
MPTVVDNGVIEGATFSGLSLDTEYYLLVFGVDEKYEACTELTKVAFKTLAVEKSDCTFEVATEVVDNSVTISVVPSDKEMYWYLCTMPKSNYDYYVNDENGYKMSEGYFYEYFFQQDINAYRGAGYTDQQIIDALIHSGDLQLQASGLNEHTEYYIGIERVRFPDIEFISEMDCCDFSIPALTIQPIVENAVKHGILKRESGGTVRVRIYESDRSYFVTVKDNGVGFDVSELERENHIGLRNIRSRLEAMCAGTLHIESIIGVGTKITVEIPKEAER